MFGLGVGQIPAGCGPKWKHGTMLSSFEQMCDELSLPQRLAETPVDGAAWAREILTEPLYRWAMYSCIGQNRKMSLAGLNCLRHIGSRPQKFRGSCPPTLGQDALPTKTHRCWWSSTNPWNAARQGASRWPDGWWVGAADQRLCSMFCWKLGPLHVYNNITQMSYWRGKVLIMSHTPMYIQLQYIL